MYNVAVVLPSVPFLERHITQQWNIIKFFSPQILVPWIFLGNIYESHAQIQKITTSGINGLICNISNCLLIDTIQHTTRLESSTTQILCPLPCSWQSSTGFIPKPPMIQAHSVSLRYILTWLCLKFPSDLFPSSTYLCYIYTLCFIWVEFSCTWIINVGYVVPVDLSSVGKCESRSIVLLIISLGVRWRWVVSS